MQTLLSLLEQGRSFIVYILSRILDFESLVSEHWRRGANRRTVLILILIGTIALYTYLQIISPPESFPVDNLISVEEGVSLDELSRELEAQQVIRSSDALRIFITLVGRATSVRAGDYVFKEPKDMFSVAEAITTGNFGLEPIRVRIPEGATTKGIAALFAKNFGRVNEEEFLRQSLGYEGYLFPDTYFFLPNASENDIIRAMRQNFDTRVNQEVMDDIVASGRTLEDTIIMASLLEREAHNYLDRRMIAGVLWRRIDKDMLLQVDAAFLYDLGRTTFDLTMADLRGDSPYNTYKFKGLPPTPIGSPSLSSIRAAANPIDKGYVFYLADHSGVTHYSKTYEEHLEKKRLYLGT